MRREIVLRQVTALLLCAAIPATSLRAQEASLPGIDPVPPAGHAILRPYREPQIPPVRLANSDRFRALIRAGTLYLTAQDAIALALENNIDIEVARYNPVLSQWNLERSEAGGALPGVPSVASQAGSVASGQGVAGSQAAAGVSGGGGGGGGGTSGNATISQIGPVTQNLDPSIQGTTAFAHNSAPQANVTQSSTANLVSGTRAYNASYGQGFLAGGSVTVTYTEHYLNENAGTDVFNPSFAPSLGVSFQQNLLRGFGAAVGGRNIRVSKINLQNSDLNFKTQVISTVVSVLTRYYSLVADYEDLRAKQSAVTTAQDFYNNTKRQEEIGTLAALDVTTSESQLATSQNDLVVSQTTLQQDELQLKNTLSRNGAGDPVLAGVRIQPLDHIVVPDRDDLPPLTDMVSQALANRADLAVQRSNITTAEISALGTKNGVLPSLQVFGGETQAGLSGAEVLTSTTSTPPDPYFVGGIGNGLAQIARRNFPSERVGVVLQVPLGNNQALADQAIDQLSLRQTQLTTEKAYNQVVVDVSNYLIAVQQARAKYQAAVRSRILAEQLLSAEQRKFALGTSIPYNVTLQQRDLATAASAEVGALSAYSSARIALDQTLGSTLETNQVSLDEARSGRVARTSAIPAGR
jgi:outer membrane protein